ncbi:MAG: RloB family protein [Planctomycetota bacterium]|jgi:hypothetical protein|nr:RloB family protein [Planctomycetota bacterium]
MPRQRRDFKRKSGLRDASLHVLACEGAQTEPEYFKGLRARLYNPKLHVEVLEREDPSQSSPGAVIQMLDEFRRDYSIRAGDQLWLVIDKDRWTNASLSQVAQECEQKGYSLVLSNPCFELWLLLHFEDVASTISERRDVLMNSQNVKREVGQLVAAGDTSLEYIDHFFPHTNEAIAWARSLEVNSTERWPSNLGTRVYRLVTALLNL